MNDLTNQRFGRLLVLSEAERINGRDAWTCVCDCGTVKRVDGKSMRRSLTKSCGCIWDEKCKTHGETRSPEWTAWANMKARCSNPKHPSFADYGGRGITVCDEWQSFTAFLAAVGRRPSARHSIDRIDNSRGYAPGNVRWTIPPIQMRNTRRNVVISMNGESLCLTDWCLRYSISRAVVGARMRLGWSFPDAINTPHVVGRKLRREAE